MYIKKINAPLTWNWLIDWGLMTLSAQIGYIVPFWKYVEVEKVKLKKKVDNFMCWDYIQYTVTINNSSIWSL